MSLFWKLGFQLEGGKKETKVLRCKAYLTVSKKYGESAANQQIVTKAGSEDVESYVRRITTTICGKPVNCPKCDGGRGGGMLDDLIKHKKACEEAITSYETTCRNTLLCHND